jgi:hypothetical protein
MRFLVMAALGLMWLANPSAQAQSAAAADPDLVGIYACEGTRPDGEHYEASVEILRNENVYQLRWILPTGDQALGIGIVSGDSLAVGYFGSLPGVVIYKIGQEGSTRQLVGTWTVVGANGRVFSETLTRLKNDPSDPAAPSTTPLPLRLRGVGRRIPL